MATWGQTPVSPVYAWTPAGVLRDLLESLCLGGALDAGQDVVSCDHVPAHLLRQCVAAFDVLLELLRRAGETGDQVLRHLLGDAVFDLIALCLADGEKLLGLQA